MRIDFYNKVMNSYNFFIISIKLYLFGFKLKVKSLNQYKTSII